MPTKAVATFAHLPTEIRLMIWNDLILTTITSLDESEWSFIYRGCRNAEFERWLRRDFNVGVDLNVGVDFCLRWATTRLREKAKTLRQSPATVHADQQGVVSGGEDCYGGLVRGGRVCQGDGLL
jgi:hypothetical protein